MSAIFSQEFNSGEDSAFAHLLSLAAADNPSVIGAPPAAGDTPAENDWRAAIGFARLESGRVVEVRSEKNFKDLVRGKA